MSGFFITARFSARLHARSRYRARVGTRKHQNVPLLIIDQRHTLET